MGFIPHQASTILRRLLGSTIVLALLNALLFIYFAYTQGPQAEALWAITGLSLGCLVGCGVALYQVQRGQTVLGAQLFLGLSALTVLGSVFFIEDLGFLLGVALLLLTTFVKEQTLPGQSVKHNLWANVGLSFALPFLDFFWPTPRLSLPTLFLFLPLLVATAGYGFYLFRRYPTYPFRTKLIIAFLTVAITSAGAVALGAQQLIRSQLTQQAGSNLQSVATAKATNIGHLLSVQLDSLKVLAFNLSQRPDLPTRNATYPADAQAIQEQLTQMDQQWLAAADTAPIVQLALNHPFANDLNAYTTFLPDNVEAFVTDTQGGLVAATNRTSDYAQADEAWWQATYAQGHGAIFVGQPVYDESSDTLAIIIAVPIYAPDTQAVMGILRTTYRLTALTTVLAESQTTHQNAGLWLPSGRIYSPAGTVTQPPTATLNSLNTLVALPYGEFNFDNTPSLVSQALVKPQNNDKAANIMVVQSLGWRVVHVVPVAEALQLVNATERLMLIIGFLVVGLVWVAAQVLARQMAQPIVRLTTTAKDLAAGHLEVQAQVESQDEIGALATTFNTMTAQLRVTLENLQAHMAELAQATHLAQTAQAEAEAANQAKSTFLANMSHELRTPLTVIVGYAEMLKEAFVGGHERHLAKIERIHLSAHHLLGLINDILDFSKIEAGRMELALEDFAVLPLLEEVLAAAQPLFAKNNNHLQMVFTEALGQIHSDPTRLRQVLLNLLSNAAKFTHAGTITFHVQRETLASGDTWLLFRIQDTGIGMSHTQLNQLFQPFKQADASTTRKYGGTGLGLVISRRLCQLLGGDILVSSELGVGSTFTVRIPALAPDPFSASEPPPATNQFMGSRVLIIDDDFVARKILAHHLEQAGFVVESAADGVTGLAHARENPPDLITLDILMPEMDGWEVLKHLKADPALQHVPVVILTMLEDAQRSFSLGASDYVLKPINTQQVLRVLAKYQKPHAAQPSQVLIVEDEPDVQMMLKDLLANTPGWQIRTAANGRAGLAELTAHPADVILLDLMMPEMDGFQFLEALRQNANWQQIPVVVVTAMELTAEQRQRLNGQVTRILQKTQVTQYTAGVVQEVCAALARRTPPPASD